MVKMQRWHPRWTAATLAALALAALALSGCASIGNPYFDASKPHHTPQGFRNTEPFEPRSLGDLLRWRWEQFRDGKPDPAQAPTPQVAPEVAFLQRNAVAGAAMQPTVTWIGHATVLLQAGGLNWLIDPMFSDRVSPLPNWIGPQRLQPPGLALTELPRIDVVLISHNHYDHLDTASVQALQRQAGGPPQFLVPLGIGPWLARHGIAGAVELDWWDVRTFQGALGPVDVRLTPARHWSARSLTDRLETLWGGFAVLAPELKVLYTGDTAYSGDFRRIRERLAPQVGPQGFDLAIIPIGAYAPRWFMKAQHADPAEAVQIHQDLNSQRSLGVHWGTFALADEAPDEPPRALATARRAAGVADETFFTLAIGETRRLPAR
jgi:N-acyl-phosphatidylethanolamine-hydrolysing phospholipase D